MRGGGESGSFAAPALLPASPELPSQWTRRADALGLARDIVRADRRRYRPLALLLLAIGEILAAAAQHSDARVDATLDGALAITPHA